MIKLNVDRTVKLQLKDAEGKVLEASLSDIHIFDGKLQNSELVKSLLFFPTERGLYCMTVRKGDNFNPIDKVVDIKNCGEYFKILSCSDGDKTYKYLWSRKRGAYKVNGVINYEN